MNFCWFAYLNNEVICAFGFGLVKHIHRGDLITEEDGWNLTLSFWLKSTKIY